MHYELCIETTRAEITPTTIAAKIKYTGEMPSRHIRRHVAMGIQMVLAVIFAFLSILMPGTSINAATHGRMPEKTFLTVSNSLMSRKNDAINIIIIIDGSIAPIIAANEPNAPFILCPV